MTAIPTELEPQEAAALAAIRAALANPRPLSAEEEAEFEQFRSRARIRRVETILLIRRGKLVFRLRGARGADLPCHPLERENRQALTQFRRPLTPVFRQAPPPSLGVRARQSKAQARAQRVLDLYPFYQHRRRDAAALMSKKLREPEHYVRRVLRETYTTEIIDSGNTGL